MENQRLHTFTEFKKGTIVCLKITLIFTCVFSIIQGVFDVESLLTTFWVSALYSFGIGLGNGVINNLLDKRWDWLENTNLRVFFGIIATIFYTIPVFLGIYYITFVGF